MDAGSKSAPCDPKTGPIKQDVIPPVSDFLASLAPIMVGGVAARSDHEDRRPGSHCRPAPARSKPFYQPKYTEKTNGESTPPAITSFSPARSGASSVRK